MNDGQYPVILVHGWNSHPGVWKKLIIHLESAKIQYHRFDHSAMTGYPLPRISGYLLDYLRKIREETGWSGPVDIVCHSIGTCIARYLLEVIDGTGRDQAVRQLIGLGPPNNGSALAELFNDPVRGEEIINRLSGVFIPDGFDPAADRIIQDVRPKSRIMLALRSAGLRHDIIYRIIVTTNPGDIPGFFPWFGGRTWEMTDDGIYRPTLDGDGVVAYHESILPGISLDVIPASRGEDQPSPDQYCHLYQPRNPFVIDLVMRYLLENPE